MTCRRINRWWSFAITALGVRWSSTFYETPVLTMPSTSTAASKPGPARSTEGFVTLPCGEREVSAPQELLGRCDCGPPRLHRRGAQRAVRLGRGEMALDVKGVVDGGVGGEKFLR